MILLICVEGKSNERHARGEEVAEFLHISLRKVGRMKKRFIEEALEMALGGHQGRKATYPRKTDGDFEARLIALSCSKPPKGHAQWSLRFLVDRVVESDSINSVSYETVRRVLKKRDQTLETDHG